jgi:hypothetical protein
MGTEIRALLDQHRPDVLALGVGGRLLMAGEALEVLPLDAAKLSARPDGQVRASLKDGPFALVIIGGAHDLTDNVRRFLVTDADDVSGDQGEFRQCLLAVLEL